MAGLSDLPSSIRYGSPYATDTPAYGGYNSGYNTGYTPSYPAASSYDPAIHFPSTPSYTPSSYTPAYSSGTTAVYGGTTQAPTAAYTPACVSNDHSLKPL